MDTKSHLQVKNTYGYVFLHMQKETRTVAAVIITTTAKSFSFNSKQEKMKPTSAWWKTVAYFFQALYS